MFFGLVLLGLLCIVCAFWNPFHVITAGMCFAMAWFERTSAIEDARDEEEEQLRERQARRHLKKISDN
jgi:hypothetical protein